MKTIRAFLQLCFMFSIFFTFSCTKFEFGYQLAPRYISNQLDDAFDFKSKRLKEIRAQLNVDFNRNHKQVARLLIKHVDEFLALADQKVLSAADFKKTIDSIYSSRKELTVLFKPSVDVVLMTLSVEESKNLNDFSLKTFKEADEKILIQKEFLKKQVKTFHKIMGFLVDDSTDAQDEIYRQFVLKHYDYFLIQEEERKLFLKKFNVLFPNKNELVNYVLNYYGGVVSAQTADYQKKHAEFLGALYDLEFKIWRTFSDQQKRAFRKNLKELKDEVLSVLN